MIETTGSENKGSTELKGSKLGKKEKEKPEGTIKSCLHSFCDAKGPHNGVPHRSI
jgi:hypothetical protein